MLQLDLGTAPVVKLRLEDLKPHELAMHQKGLARAKKYLQAEAELLESIIEIDSSKLYQKFGYGFITPYCVEEYGLSPDVAAVFVRVARKSVEVPELKLAIDDGGLTLFKAKVIASVVTPENQEEWIEKAKTLPKSKLEQQVAAVNPAAAKPERDKPIGEDLVRVEVYLTRQQHEDLKRSRDIVSRRLGRAATLGETVAASIQVHLDYRDPVRKAQRAAGKKARPSHPKPGAQEPKEQSRDQYCSAKMAIG